MQSLDLSSDSHVRNAMRLTQARRRLFHDLIGIRNLRKISQAQVARAIGINRSGISRFEADIEGSNPTIDVILRYAHAVGASIHMHAEPVERTEARRHRPLYRLSTTAASRSRSRFQTEQTRSPDHDHGMWVFAPGGNQ